MFKKSCSVGKSFFGNFGTYDSSRLFNDGLVDPFDQMVPTSMSPLSSRVSSLRTHSSSSDFGTQVYSRKVFVGGLPPDIDEGLLSVAFHPLVVDLECSIFLQTKLQPASDTLVL